MMALLLWVFAVVLVAVGFVRLLSGDVLFGLVLIVAGFLIGPGGVSLLGVT